MAEVCASCRHYDTNDRMGSKCRCTKYDVYLYGDDTCKSFHEDNNRSQSEIDSYINGNSGCCIITKAFQEHQKESFNDKSYELETIRKMRNLFKERYSDDIRYYYMHSPYVVQGINKLENSKEIWEFLYNELVVRTVRLIENEKFDEAYSNYKTITTDLFNQYC